MIEKDKVVMVRRCWEKCM